MSDSEHGHSTGYFLDLYKTDPVRAERERTEEIERFISAVPPERQAQLRSLQWRVDQERVRHKDSPLGSAVAIYGLMMKKVYGEHGFLDALDALLKPSLAPRAHIPDPGSVCYVDFVKNKKDKNA